MIGRFVWPLAALLLGTGAAQAGESIGRYEFVFPLQDSQQQSVWVGDTATGEAWFCTAGSCTAVVTELSIRTAGRKESTLPHPSKDAAPTKPPR
jgi:hypothetical protein